MRPEHTFESTLRHLRDSMRSLKATADDMQGDLDRISSLLYTEGDWELMARLVQNRFARYHRRLRRIATALNKVDFFMDRIPTALRRYEEGLGRW